MLHLSLATRILNENPDTCAQILSTSLRLGTIIFSLFVLTGQVRLLQKWTFLAFFPPLFFYFSFATIFPFFIGYLLGFISVSKVTHFGSFRTMEFDGVTVPLKSKLTVNRVLILETQDSILGSPNFPGSSLESRGSSLESRWSRIEDQVSNFEFKRTCHESALFKSVHLPFILKNYRSMHWVRLVHFQVNKACALKAEKSSLLVSC